MLQTGIRVSELVNLEGRDVKMYKRSGEIRIVNAKGGKERVVALNHAARKALCNYTEEGDLSNRTWIFLSKRNEKLKIKAKFLKILIHLMEAHHILSHCMNLFLINLNLFLKIGGFILKPFHLKLAIQKIFHIKKLFNASSHKEEKELIP